MDILNTIETRRSIRKYKPLPVPEENLRKILDAARLAPSAGNKQPWGFIVVRDAVRKRKLAEAARNQMWASEASVFIAVFSDPAVPGAYARWLERDPMIAVEHIVLAAWSLGYGSCWIGAFEEDKVKSLLEIPGDKKVICLLPIGIPDESPPAKPRRVFNEVFHLEVFGKQLDL